MHERIFGQEYEYSLTYKPADPQASELTNNSVGQIAVNVANEQLRSSGRTSAYWPNGGKLYHDRGHMEWAGPECHSAWQAVVFDKAGERLMDQIADATERALAQRGQPGTIMIAKNNVDPQGHTYGCHENYLIQRSTEVLPNADEFFSYLLRQLIPFLVSRVILCGNGRVTPSGFQISQRAAFISQVVSDNTVENRAIINTRDESHTANDKRYRRLHLILGDANMAEWATFLKLGTTALVLEMIEDTFLDAGPELRSPVEALHTFSADLQLERTVPLLDGTQATALQIQRHYLEAAQRYFSPKADFHTDTLLTTWANALQDLDKGADWKWIGRLDWVTKKGFLEAHRQGPLPWSDPRLQEMDMLYHSVRHEASLFATLEETGLIQPLIQPRDEITYAITHPPAFTRAWVRAAALQRGATIPNWDEIILASSSRPLPLPDPFEWCPSRVLQMLDMKSSELLTRLREGLASDFSAVRIYAVRELGQLGGLEAARVILGAVTDRDPRVRAAAAEALSHLHHPEILNALQALTADPHFLVRFRATDALHALGET